MIPGSWRNQSRRQHAWLSGVVAQRQIQGLRKKTGTRAARVAFFEHPEDHLQAFDKSANPCVY